VKILFVEGKQLEPIQALVRLINHPFRLMYRKEQELYLLEVWAYPPELEEQVKEMEGFKSWTFELMETNV
jgi:hypothetical protein